MRDNCPGYTSSSMTGFSNPGWTSYFLPEMTCHLPDQHSSQNDDMVCWKKVVLRKDPAALRSTILCTLCLESFSLHCVQMSLGRINWSRQFIRAVINWVGLTWKLHLFQYTMTARLSWPEAEAVQKLHLTCSNCSRCQCSHGSCTSHTRTLIWYRVKIAGWCWTQ